MINLTKSGESISLTKGIDLDKGTAPNMVLNLNWNHNPTQNQGFFAKLFGGDNSIDLDLGCLYEMQDGSVGVVQALGNAWGNYRSPPYLELDGDDRSGQSTDGENIRINGQHWGNIKRVLVYAFIYEGAPNWAATDGVVTISGVGEDVQVRMTDSGSQKGLCGIAMLKNDGGAVKVTRLVEYYKNQSDLDRAHGFGLRWGHGTK